MTARALDVLVVLLAAALLLMAATGGIDFDLGPLRVRLHEWMRPLVLLIVAAAARSAIGWRREGRTTRVPAAVAARALVALTIALGCLYARDHVRVAGGLDSYGYVSAAQLIAGGRLRETPPLAAVLPLDDPLSAATPLGYVPGADGRTAVPRFPLGLPIAMAVFTVFGATGPFFVPLVMAYASIVLAYLLGRGPSQSDLGGLSGLFAATLVAADPLFAAYAIQPMSDVPATCWLLAALWAAHKGATPVVWGLVAGVCAGMATMTRPALLPAALVLVLVTAGRRPSRSALALGSTVAAFVVLQLSINVALYGSVAASGYGNTSHMFELSLARMTANVVNFGIWLTYSHTALFWVLWPGALWVLRKDRWAWQMSAVAAAAAVPYLFYLVFDDWESSRFLLPSIAIVLILFARAVARLPRAAPALVLAVGLAAAASSHRFLEREGISRLQTLEAKYALVGEWFKANTSPRAVVLAGLHSGAIRLYGDRETVRWDHVPAGALVPTLDALIAAGYEPYLALDLPSEPPLFQDRFGEQPVHTEQIARVRVVNIYRFVSAR